jgi:hypothetical protein
VTFLVGEKPSHLRLQHEIAPLLTMALKPVFVAYESVMTMTEKDSRTETV